METNINSEEKLSPAADCEQARRPVMCFRSSTGMTSRRTEESEAALIPLFLGKQRCNITFVVDSSEDTRAALDSVKRLLIRTLLTKASLRDSLFNIVTFAGEVTCWSHHMLPCAPDTVYVALSWIHSISCRPGRDLLAALSMALSDPACHAIHLLCTALPDQPEAVLRALPALAAGRSVNVFYLQHSGGQLCSNARDFMQCLTWATGGSCYVIPVGLNGVLEKVVPLCVVLNQSSVPSSSPARCCCLSTSVLVPHSTSLPLLRCSLGNRLCPVPTCMLSGQTLDGPEFFPGGRVLARRGVDGFYHLGTVIQQGCGGVWVVEFDHPGKASLGAVSSQRQLVCSLDMVHHTKAHTRCLVPGDAVLSPWEPDLRRYGPGRLMAAAERREGCGVDGLTSLRVLMWNGCVSLVPGSLLLPISASRHGRIARELQTLTSASNHCCSWLCARSSSCTPQLLCSDCGQSPPCCSSVTNQQTAMCPPSCRSSFVRMDGFEKAQQNKQVDRKDTIVKESDPEVPSSSPSSSSSLSEDESRTVKRRSEQQRPPWRYWRRTGPEPQHRQPGSAEPRRASRPLRFSFPLPQISASPNHSAMFHSLPGAKGVRTNFQDVFGRTHFKPRPPVGLRPFSGNNATTVYT